MQQQTELMGAARKQQDSSSRWVRPCPQSSSRQCPQALGTCQWQQLCRHQHLALAQSPAVRPNQQQQQQQRRLQVCVRVDLQVPLAGQSVGRGVLMVVLLTRPTTRQPVKQGTTTAPGALMGLKQQTVTWTQT